MKKQALGLGIVVLLGILPMSPALLNPYEDSGAYAYIGQVIREGGVPYRDAWDHKPPLTFYLDALSFVFWGENRWALWVLGGVTAGVTGWLMLRLLREVGLSQRRAVLGGIGFVLLICRSDWEGTNTPEFYALPFQTLCLWAGVRLLRTPCYRWALLTGLAAGLALLAKQTTVGAAITLVPAVCLAQRSPRALWTHWKTWLVLAGGGLAAPAAMALYLLARGALPDAVDALWTFNRVYGGTLSFPEMVRSTLASVLVVQMFGPLLFFALVGMAGRWLSSAQQPGAERETGWRLWFALTCVLDFCLTNLASRGYPHYYFTPLPEFMVLAVSGLSTWLDRDRLPRLRRPIRWVTWSYLALAILIPSLMELVLALAASDGKLWGPSKLRPVIEYVQAHSSPGDTVLNWGHAGNVNFGANRRSPSRYSYSQPLTLRGYSNPRRIAQFLADLQRNRPVLIVDTTMPGIPVLRDSVPPLSRVLHAPWKRAYGGQEFPGLDGLYDFVAEHCTLETVITNSMIYHCRYPESGGSG